MIKQTTIILLGLFLFSGYVQATESKWLEDFDEAITISVETNKPILMVFSGSDWCKPCMILEKTVFATERFNRFAQDSLVLLKMDFPSRKVNQPSKEIMKKRELVAEQFNKSGTFPSVILLDANKKIIGKTGYKDLSVENYINHLKSFLTGYNYTGELTPSSQKKYKRDIKLMGSAFELVAVSNNNKSAQQAIEKAIIEIQRIENLISSWDKNSQTYQINLNAGIKPVKVDKELFFLIKRALKVSVLTNGAFDISFASINKHWKFDKTMTQLPNKEELLKSVEKINYKNIVLNEKELTVYLKEKEMKIGFGAIGKGYAANQASKIMKGLGIENGMINAGGDLIAWGDGFDNEKWKIGIADPNKKNGIISWLKIENMAVVTSGDYERYSIIDGVRYAHIIDPRTGYPSTGLKSVTIVCKDAEIADALATSVFVLGEKKGLFLINELKDIECVLVNDNDEILSSNNLNINYINANN